MRTVPKFFCIGVLLGLSVLGTSAAQENVETPSQKTKQAIEKFSKTPATIGKSLEALTEAAKAKLQQAIGGKSKEKNVKPGGEDLSLPPKKSEQPGPARFSSSEKRDPFRPMTMRTRTSSQPRDNLSPLERFDLGQLKVVGIVWDIKEPKAMVEDTAGLGYIIKVGTPIGANDGQVKAIHPKEIVVEEFYADFYGAKKRRDVILRLLTE